MIVQTYVKTRDVCKVQFQLFANELPEEVAVEKINLAGSFNHWDGADTPLTYNKKLGAYQATVELEPNQDYEFRYLINDSVWWNDWAADEYVPSGHGP